jgi:PKHD-type hydroxylase
MSNLYWKWDSVIPKDICEHIIKNVNWEKKEIGSVLREDESFFHDENIRKTEIVFDPPLSLSECILRSYITVANKSAQWNYILTDIQRIQIGKYVVGGHYKYHKDAEFPSNKKIDRKLSAVLFLSDPNDYEGGLFEIEELNNQIDKPTQGSIIVFPSCIRHRVTPIIKGERYSAVAWAEGPALK